MANSPMKRAGFNQGIYQTSSARKEVLGTLRMLQDGRMFRYARAGASALAPGKLSIAAALAAVDVNIAATYAAAIGTKMITQTLVAGTTILADELKGGALQVNDATGEGYSYVIESNTPVLVGGTSITLSLEEGIKVALVAATSEITLVHNPWNDTHESTTIGTPAGVPLVVVPISDYYWAQVGGLGIGWIDGTPATGSGLIQSNGVAGAFEIAAGSGVPEIATIHTTGVADEYKPIHLMII